MALDGRSKSVPPGYTPIDLKLDSQGRWLANGEPILHERTLEVLFRGLSHDPDGGWRVAIGREATSVTVEDTGLFVVRVEWGKDDGLLATLADGREEVVDLDTLRLAGTRLTFRSAASGGLEARFLAAAYHQTLLKAEEGPAGEYWLKAGGKRVRLG